LNKMFRLPTCPQCGTIYRYGDIVRILRQNIFKGRRNTDRAEECYHCQAKFRVKYLPGILILTALWAALSIGTNLLLLSRMTQLNLIAMFLMTIVYMILAIVLVPFFVRFQRCEKKKR